jgi:CubicO group peptidase (beta-lactamase class C family)
VGRGDRPLFFEAYGKADLFSGRTMTRETVFDLASLTKPLATALAVARLSDKGRVAFDRPVADYLPALRGSDKASITVRQLLGHRSGLPAHRRFYMVLKSMSPDQRHDHVLDLLKRTPLDNAPGSIRCYSDLGFMLLCRLVETLADGPMDRFLATEIYEPMGVDDLFFVNLAGGRRPPHDFAATELCPLRKRLLVGEVHDDNAWYAGGIDGQAGLFGTAKAVFQLLRQLVADFRGHGTPPFFSRKVLLEMLTGSELDQSLMGFDRPSSEDSSAGHYFSSNSIGHLGYTGTSFWMDLEKDQCIVLLTNRVHPSRWNQRLRQFRPLVHDRIMEHFEI